MLMRSRKKKEKIMLRFELMLYIKMTVNIGTKASVSPRGILRLRSSTMSYIIMDIAGTPIQDSEIASTAVVSKHTLSIKMSAHYTLT